MGSDLRVFPLALHVQEGVAEVGLLVNSQPIDPPDGVHGFIYDVHSFEFDDGRDGHSSVAPRPVDLSVFTDIDFDRRGFSLGSVEDIEGRDVVGTVVCRICWFADRQLEAKASRPFPLDPDHRIVVEILSTAPSIFLFFEFCLEESVERLQFLPEGFHFGRVEIDVDVELGGIFAGKLGETKNDNARRDLEEYALPPTLCGVLNVDALGWGVGDFLGVAVGDGGGVEVDIFVPGWCSVSPNLLLVHLGCRYSLSDSFCSLPITSYLDKNLFL